MTIATGDTGKGLPHRSDIEPPLREKKPNPTQRPDPKDHREMERRQGVDTGPGGDAADQ